MSKFAQKYNMGFISSSVSQYVTLGLNTVAKIHYLHLVTDSYARHMALDEFYKEFPDDYLDSVAESALANDMTLSYVEVDHMSGDPLELLERLYDSGSALSDLLSDKREFRGLLNAIDDSLEFIKLIIYKIKRFK